MVKHSVRDYWYDDEKDQLGEGTFGKVFLARHSQDENKKVAIKAINLKQSSVKRTPSATREREIHILEILRSAVHPNLVKFHFDEKAGFMIYMVMEFCNGGNLGEYREDSSDLTKETLTESTIRCFFKQIGNGVKFLHKNGIIHRDLKPENILLNYVEQECPTPEKIILKIADFGLGRFLPPDGCTLTDCGTPRYTAPEVSSKHYDEKVDLWSVGVMIFECIVGTTKAREDLENRVFPAFTSSELKELLTGLLNKEPQHRFDCDQLLKHSFMDENIQVSVQIQTRTELMKIPKSASLNELLQKVSRSSGISNDTDSFYLSHQGVVLENCHQSRVEDSGIRNGSIIVLVCRQSGGKRGGWTQLEDGYLT